MTITLTVKETQEYAQNCRDWGRERAVVFARAVDGEMLKVHPQQALQEGERAADQWETENPFPKLID